MEDNVRQVQEFYDIDVQLVVSNIKTY